jgi:PleD family two-component response regulator
LEVSFEDKSLRFTVSAGVAQLDPLRASWESMMRRADRSMDEAKENGRNAVCFAADIRDATHVEVEMTSL